MLEINYYYCNMDNPNFVHDVQLLDSSCSVCLKLQYGSLVSFMYMICDLNCWFKHVLFQFLSLLPNHISVEYGLKMVLR